MAQRWAGGLPNKNTSKLTQGRVTEICFMLNSQLQLALIRWCCKLFTDMLCSLSEIWRWQYFFWGLLPCQRTRWIFLKIADNYFLNILENIVEFVQGLNVKSLCYIRDRTWDKTVSLNLFHGPSLHWFLWYTSFFVSICSYFSKESWSKQLKTLLFSMKDLQSIFVAKEP